MTFQEIFNEDGLYASKDFVHGFAFRIEDGYLSNVQYSSKSDLMPIRQNQGVYKSLFTHEYERVFNIGQLFKK